MGPEVRALKHWTHSTTRRRISSRRSSSPSDAIARSRDIWTPEPSGRTRRSILPSPFLPQWRQPRRTLCARTASLRSGIVMGISSKRVDANVLRPRALESGQAKGQEEGAGAPTQPRGAPALGQRTLKARSDNTVDGAQWASFLFRRLASQRSALATSSIYKLPLEAKTRRRKWEEGLVRGWRGVAGAA